MSQEFEQVKRQAAVFGGTFVPLLAIDVMRGGGIAGGILCVGASFAATKFAPAIEPYVEDFKQAVASYRERRNNAKGEQVDYSQMEQQGQIDYPQESVTEQLPQETYAQGIIPTPEQIEQALLSPVFPLYREDETLKLGKAIDRMAVQMLSEAYIKSLQSGKRVTVDVPGQRFDPHFNGLFGKGIITAANQGFGKSVLNGIIIEQAGRCRVPVIVLDHKGEYSPITELPFVNGLIAGCDCQFDLTPDNAYEFVAMVMENANNPYQAIVNLASYGSAWIDRARVVAAVGKALMQYAEDQRRGGYDLLPCLVLVDEAQLYIPQNVQLLPPEAQENKSVLNELNNAYFALVSNGRSNGYTMCFSTQSLTYVAKWAIKSCQIRILGRHGEKNDLDMCEQIINPSVATRSEIEAFAPGVFVVFGFTPQPMVVQFDKKQSRDLSETPGMERLRQQRRVQPSPVPSSPMPRVVNTDDLDGKSITSNVTLDHIMLLLQSMKDVDPDDTRYASHQAEERMERPCYLPRRPVSQMPVQQLQAPSRKPSQALPPSLQIALENYEPGMSYRDLGKKINVNKDTAGKRIEELRRRKLI